MGKFLTLPTLRQPGFLVLLFQVPPPRRVHYDEVTVFSFSSLTSFWGTRFWEVVVKQKAKE